VTDPKTRRADLKLWFVLGVLLWLGGALLLAFGPEVAWRLAGAVPFAAGIGLCLWAGFRDKRRP